jgi:hypothetical protein
MRNKQRLTRILSPNYNFQDPSAPAERARKIAVLTPRTEAEIQALKNQLGR